MAPEACVRAPDSGWGCDENIWRRKKEGRHEKSEEISEAHHVYATTSWDAARGDPIFVPRKVILKEPFVPGAEFVQLANIKNETVESRTTILKIPHIALTGHWVKKQEKLTLSLQGPKVDQALINALNGVLGLADVEIFFECYGRCDYRIPFGKFRHESLAMAIVVIMDVMEDSGFSCPHSPHYWENLPADGENEKEGGKGYRWDGDSVRFMFVFHK